MYCPYGARNHEFDLWNPVASHIHPRYRSGSNLSCNSEPAICSSTLHFSLIGKHYDPARRKTANLTKFSFFSRGSYIHLSLSIRAELYKREWTHDVLFHIKLHLDRCIVSLLMRQNTKFNHILKLYILWWRHLVTRIRTWTLVHSYLPSLFKISKSFLNTNSLMSIARPQAWPFRNETTNKKHRTFSSPTACEVRTNHTHRGYRKVRFGPPYLFWIQRMASPLVVAKNSV